MASKKFQEAERVLAKWGPFIDNLYTFSHLLRQSAVLESEHEGLHKTRDELYKTIEELEISRNKAVEEIEERKTYFETQQHAHVAEMEKLRAEEEKERARVQDEVQKAQAAATAEKAKLQKEHEAHVEAMQHQVLEWERKLDMAKQAYDDMRQKVLG